MIDKTILADTRARYLSGKMSHADYYEWLADEIGVTPAMLPVSLNRIRQSNDPYLNDISLNNWDAKDYAVRSRATARKLPWSLSDTVCTLKAVAHRAIRK